MGLVSDWEGHRGPYGGIRNILYLNLGINALQAVHLPFLHFTKCYMSMKRNMSAQHFGYPIDSAQCLPGVISFIALMVHCVQATSGPVLFILSN